MTSYQSHLGSYDVSDTSHNICNLLVIKLTILLYWDYYFVAVGPIAVDKVLASSNTTNLRVLNHMANKCQQGQWPTKANKGQQGQQWPTMANKGQQGHNANAR